MGLLGRGGRCREKCPDPYSGQLATSRMGGGRLRVTSQVLTSLLSSLRVPTVLQVPRAWLVRGASLVCQGSVVSEDSPACPAHR